MALVSFFDWGTLNSALQTRCPNNPSLSTNFAFSNFFPKCVFFANTLIKRYIRQGNEHHLPTTAVKIHVTYELNCLFVYNVDPNLARSVTIMIYFLVTSQFPFTT